MRVGIDSGKFLPEKPDFGRMANKYAVENVVKHNDLRMQEMLRHYAAQDFKAGMEFTWQSHVLPALEKIKELDKEVNDTRADLGRALKGLNESHLQKTNEDLRSKNLTLKNKLKARDNRISELEEALKQKER